MEQNTYCRFCLGSCGLILKRENGTVKVRGDKNNQHSKGYICKKGANIERFYGDDGSRIKKFSYRTKEVSEAEFFSKLSEHLKSIIQLYGPDSVGVYFGTHAILDSSGIWAGMGFLYRLKSSSFFTVGSIDNIKKVYVAHEITRGANPGAVNVVDEGRSDFCLIVGSNPVRSNGHLYSNINFKKRLREHQNSGRFSLCVDPRRTETAKASSLHLAIKPNTDHILVSFLVKSVFDELNNDELSVRLFGKSKTSEVAELRAIFDRLTLSNTSLLCGIDEIVLSESAAKLVASSTFSFISGTGVSFAENGILTEWLLYVLCALKDGFGPERGNGFLGCNKQEETAVECDLDKFGDFCTRVVGQGKVARKEELPCSSFEDLVDGGQLKALVVLGGNPVAAFPGDVNRVLSSLDALVALNTHHNQTTMLANYVCPVAGPLEREDSTVYVSSNISSGVQQYTEALLPAEGDVMYAWEFFSKLGDQLGIDVTRLKKQTNDITTAEVIRTIRGFEKFQFKGNRNKHEDSRMSLKDISLEKSPNLLSENFIESLSTELRIATELISTDKKFSDNDFYLISGRQPDFLNSADICDITNTTKRNIVYMNVEDVEAFGIHVPATVEVISHSNGVTLQGDVFPTADLKRGCIWIPQSDNFINVSSLCESDVVCTKTAMPTQTGFLVRVRSLNSVD